MKKRLLQFYDSFGDKGVMFILYTLCVVINAMPAVAMELPIVFPDEIYTAGTAAVFSGKNWTALLGDLSAAGGYIQALFYTPLFLVLKNPYVLYKAMLIVNSLLMGFIPLIAYHLAGKFGVLRVRRKLLIALCCGLYAAYIVNSKYVWSETLTCLLGWVLVLCFFSSWGKSSRSGRAAMSMLTGFLCVVSFAASTRLIALVAAVILTAVIARAVFREKILNLPVFGITLTASFCAEFLLRNTVEESVGQKSISFFEIFGSADTSDFWGVFFSHLYAFMTSSLGMGALAAAVFAVMTFSYLAEGIKGRAKTLEDGTKVYEAVKHKYSVHLTVFSLFQFMAVGCTAVMSALFMFGNERFSAGSAVFGRYTDNIAPFAVFLVLTYIFLYGIDLVKPLIGAAIYGYSCFCFAVSGRSLVQSTEQLYHSPLFGIFPTVFNEETGAVSSMSYVIMSSCVFSLYALVIVFVSCTRKHRTTVVTGAVFSVVMAASAIVCVLHVPKTGAHNSEVLEPYIEVMDLLYNDSQSPPIKVYEAQPELAATLQFLAPETSVAIMRKGDSVPESCLLIAAADEQAPFEGGSYDVVGKTSSYTVYAYGETARSFILYSRNKKENML